MFTSLIHVDEAVRSRCAARLDGAAKLSNVAPERPLEFIKQILIVDATFVVSVRCLIGLNIKCGFFFVLRLLYVV